MKTDRELLELAAKAAGCNLVWGDVYIIDGENIDCTDLPYVRSNQQDEADWYWNPLEDDGDALRLAVKLNLSICFTLGESAPPFGTVMTGYSPWENKAPIAHERYNTPGEKMAATRRTIVRASATIGESMP